MAGSARIIAGTVLDAAGKPVAQARVYFSSAPGPIPDIAAMTDSAGRFKLSAPQPGTYEISARSEASNTGSARVIVAGADATVEIRLKP